MLITIPAMVRSMAVSSADRHGHSSRKQHLQQPTELQLATYWAYQGLNFWYSIVTSLGSRSSNMVSVAVKMFAPFTFRTASTQLCHSQT